MFSILSDLGYMCRIYAASVIARIVIRLTG